MVAINAEEWGDKKKPYRWPDDVHDEVLARLLELNAERAREEALAGTAGREEAGAEGGGGARATVVRRVPLGPITLRFPGSTRSRHSMPRESWAIRRQGRGQATVITLDSRRAG
jgi:hypothetical protein